jgi:hypothetical protein
MTKRTSNKFSLVVRARAPLILLRFQYFRMPSGGCIVRARLWAVGWRPR